MTITPNYNPNPLSPKIIITDLNDVEKYRYETKVTTDSVNPQQDFKLEEMSVHMGINSDFGYATLKIQDPDNILTDTSSARRDSKIERQWNIQIFFGKTNLLTQRWFYGKIYDVDVIRPRTNRQHLIISCIGWGVVLRDRVTNIRRFQKKQADGVTVDSTDTAVKISELFKDVVQDTDHLADQGLTQNHSITVNGVEDLDLKLPDLQKSYSTFATVLSELSTTGNTMWGVDADRDMFLRDPSSKDSGFLFTNNLDGTTAQNWNSSKIGYLTQASQSWRDSSFDSAYSILHGLGSDSVAKDQENSGGENATRASNVSWVAIPFTPQVDNIAKIAFRMAKTGTPTASGTIEIVGEDASNLPNRSNLRKSVIMPSAKIQSLTGSGDWVEFGFTDKLQVEPKTNLFFVFPVYGDGSNNFTLDYKTGTGTFYTSSDGTTWSSATGLFSLRTYERKALHIILENTRAKAKYGTREKVINFTAGLEEPTAREAIISAGQVLGLERRFYSQVTVSPTTDRIPLGQSCKIEDEKTGLSIKANIISIDLNMSASQDSKLGATQVILGLEEVHY